VTYRAISSRWPGLFRIEGLDVRGRTARGIDWEVSADRARVQLSPLSLLAKTVLVRGAELEGVEVRQLVPRPEDAPRPTGLPKLRPMTAAAPRPRAGAAAQGRPATGEAAGWSFVFRDLEVRDIRVLNLDSVSIDGTIHGEVGFTIDTASGRAEILHSRLDLDSVTVRHEDRIVGRGIGGKVELALEPYLYKEERGRALFPYVGGHVVLKGELDDAPIVDELVNRVEWVRVESGVAPIDADLRLRRGRLLAGSRLIAPRSARHARVLDFELEGSNGLSLEVGDEARWELRFAAFQLRRAGVDTPLLVGDGVALVGVAHDLDLATLADHSEVALEIDGATLPDLGFVRAWLPPSAGIGRLGGSARVHGKVGARVADRQPFGNLDLQFDSVDLDWRGHEFTGRVDAQIPIAGGNVVERRLELDGTRVALKDFAAPSLASAGGAAPSGWWMQLLLDKGSIDLGPPVSVGGEFGLRLRDTAPLLAIFETRRDLPRWAERILSKEDVHASGAFRGRPGDLSLDRLETELLGGRLRARLHFAGADRAGKLMLGWRRLAIGVGFRGAAREIRVRDTRDWFEEGE